MLDIWTGGKYKATPHRVKNSSNQNRLSAPFFFDPCFDALIDPAARENEVVVDGKESPWSKPFLYGMYYRKKKIYIYYISYDKLLDSYSLGSYIHNKVLHNFPELADETNAQFYDL